MQNHQFVVCVDNRGYEVSLELRKLYEVLPDAGAAKHSQLRVIDESGEDYLYPATLFDRVELPLGIAERVYRAHGQPANLTDQP